MPSEVRTLRRDLDALSQRDFDVIVIGAGITGAAVAHDAALRGLSVALIDKGDFGSATSSASSKLLHSGIRYLQGLEFGKVRESAEERAAFLRIAPHLTRCVPFVIPTTPGLLRGRAALAAAIRLHALITAGTNAGVPASRILSRKETLDRAPILEGLTGLTGSAVLYEAHMHSSERMTLAFVKSAVGNGASVANYLQANSLSATGDGRQCLNVLDREGGNTFDIRARLVLNAAGPWIPALSQALGAGGLRTSVAGFSKGAHLVTRPLTTDVALALSTSKHQRKVIDRGGRHFFVIPWRGLSLIGTSNVPYSGNPDDVCATSDDVRDFLTDVNAALPGAHLTSDDVQHTFAGLYPLTETEIRPDVYQGTGTYQIVDHHPSASGGVVSVLGAKYTTARRVAEQAVDLAVTKLGRRAACRTGTTPLAGGDIENVTALESALAAQQAGLVDNAAIRYLVGHYGTEAAAVLSLHASDVRSHAAIAPGRECVEAEVLYAVEHEMALRLSDVVCRRTGLGTIGHPGRAGLERAADIMAVRLGWTPARRDAEIADVDARIGVPRS